MGKDEKWQSPYWRTEEALDEALSWLKEKNNPSLHKVGQGRLTEVYSLKSDKFEFPLAIKAPIFGDEVQMEEGKRKLLRDGWEMSYAARMLPQYFPRVCMYEEAGRFLIREYRCGEPLMEYLKKQNISTRQTYFYKITEMAARVMELHFDFSQGAKVFGGFASGNIVVNPESQELSLLDCGSVVEEQRPYIRRAQEIGINSGRGAAHIPLEKALGQQELCDRRIDFFGYGVLAYEVLFLEQPYASIHFDEETSWRRYHEAYKRAVMHLETAEEAQGLPHDLLLQCIGAMHPDVHKRFCGRLITT